MYNYKCTKDLVLKYERNGIFFLAIFKIVFKVEFLWKEQLVKLLRTNKCHICCRYIVEQPKFEEMDMYSYCIDELKASQSRNKTNVDC